MCNFCYDVDFKTKPNAKQAKIIGLFSSDFFSKIFL